MSLVRWDPFREMEEMSSRLRNYFAWPRTRDVNTSREMMTAPDWSPVVDISETNEEYIIKAELPEVKKEDVKVTVDNGVLTLQGERKHEKEEKGKKFHRIERFYGSFMRTFSLPDDADENKIHADFKDGILLLRVIKNPKAARPKAIDVKVV